MFAQSAGKWEHFNAVHVNPFIIVRETIKNKYFLPKNISLHPSLLF